MDLIIGTGGDRRLSDVLVWECAYADLVFRERLWPDFGADDLDVALAECARRARRYGGVKAAAPVRAAS